MVDFRKAKASFEAIGKTLKIRNIRPQEDEGKFIKKVTDACIHDTDTCFFVTNEEVISAIMQSQQSCVVFDELCQVKCVLFTSACRRLIKDDADVDKVIKILAKTTDEDIRCCVCFEVSSGLRLHCQSCTSPICKDCFLGIALANGRRIPDNEDEEDFDFHEPTHDISCPTCRTKVNAYRWMTEACLPTTTRSFSDFDQAIKAVLTSSKAPFMMGSVLKNVFFDDSDSDEDESGPNKFEDDLILTKSLGAVWVQDNIVMCAPTGLDNTYHNIVHEDCEAVVLGHVPKCVCCADAYDHSGVVLVKIGNLIHDISETFPLYASYIAINNNYAKNMKKEEDEERVYYRIHRSVEEARKRWDAIWKKEREDLLKNAEGQLSEVREAAAKKLNTEREKFLEITTFFKDREQGDLDFSKLELLTKLKQIELDRLRLLNSSAELRNMELTRLDLVPNSTFSSCYINT